jgi:hypothetical protein
LGIYHEQHTRIGLHITRSALYFCQRRPLAEQQEQLAANPMLERFQADGTINQLSFTKEFELVLP